MVHSTGRKKARQVNNVPQKKKRKTFFLSHKRSYLASTYSPKAHWMGDNRGNWPVYKDCDHKWILIYCYASTKKFRRSHEQDPYQTLSLIFTSVSTREKHNLQNSFGRLYSWVVFYCWEVAGENLWLLQFLLISLQSFISFSLFRLKM